MEQKLITLKNGQVKAIFEYFGKLLQEDGKNAEFSYMIYKNSELLASQYAEIMPKLYNEQADANFQEFVKKLNELVVQYADRDEQGNIVLDEQNKPKITEQIAEFKTANDSLLEENKAVLDNREQRINETVQLLETAYEFNLYVIKLESFPPETMPAIVGMFGV